VTLCLWVSVNRAIVVTAAINLCV